jgi:hypothetical protein
MPNDFDIAKILSNPLNAFFLSMNPQAMQMVQAITGQRIQNEERNYRRQKDEREFGLRKQQIDRQVRSDEEERKYREVQLANIRTDNERQAQAQKATAEKQTRDEAYKLNKDSADQRADLSRQGGEYVASPSALLFGKSVTNRGNIIESVDNKGFYRLPNQDQKQQRELELARAKGEADLRLDVKKRQQMSPLELQEYEKKQQIEAKYRPAKDESNAVYAEQDSVQKLIDAAKKLEAAGEDATAAWSAAETAATNAAKRFPQLEGGRGSNGHVYIKQREGARMTRPKAGAVQTGAAGKTIMTRVQYLQMVKEAKENGEGTQADVDALLKARGIKVQ